MIVAAMATLGFLGVELSYVPQIGRLFRRRSAEDVSLLFPLLNVLGRLAILAYAIASNQPIFTWGFAAGCALRLVLLGQVIYYRARPDVGTSIIANRLSIAPGKPS